MADLLQAGGHDVWWDFAIAGGARFAAAIDAALKDADAVVVLWSTESIGSAWVQDEAAVGRDSERLIPVLLDDVEPPLGFRQYQSIGFIDWSGRGSPRQLSRLLAAIGNLGSPQPVPETKHRRPLVLPSPRYFVAATMVLLAFAAIGLLWFRSNSASAAPSVSVAASKAAPGQASTALADDVAIDLGRFQAGPLSGLSIAGPGQVRDSDYRVETAVTSTPGGQHADVTLLDRAGTIIWTAGADAAPGRFVDLRQQVSAQVGGVLACTVHVPDMRPRPTDDVLRLYLNGCADIYGSATNSADDTSYGLFLRMIAKEPRLAEGWAGAALLEAWSADADDSELTRTATEHLTHAEQLNPHLDMVYAARANLYPFNDRKWGLALDTLERGLKDNPDSALLYGEQVTALEHVGRMHDAVNAAYTALELNPLSPALSDGFISALAYSGQGQAAERELEKAEKLWPGSTLLEQTRYRFDFRYGDAAAAQRQIKERADILGVSDTPALDAFAAARISPTAANKQLAVDAYWAQYRRNPVYAVGLLQALGNFGRVDEAYAILQDMPTVQLISGSDVLWRPDMASIRYDPRFMALSARTGLVRLWRQSGKWPDFCSDPKLPYDCKKEAAKYR